MDNNPALTAILTRLRPDKTAEIRTLIENAVARQFGETPDPAAVTRFLDDIRVAQSMSAIDINYAEHYTDLHQTGVDFMRLVQTVKAADKNA